MFAHAHTCIYLYILVCHWYNLLHTDLFRFAGNVCLVDGKLPISVLILTEAQTLVHFNMLFAHLFFHLSKSQAMSVYEINPSELLRLTISALVESSFPAIKATDNQPTPFVSPRTVAYIHALVINTVSMHHSDSPNARALRNETMVRQELQNMTPVAFRNELRSCFVSYYEGILKMDGAISIH
jgi:hypothetical protein